MEQNSFTTTQSLREDQSLVFDNQSYQVDTDVAPESDAISIEFPSSASALDDQQLGGQRSTSNVTPQHRHWTSKDGLNKRALSLDNQSYRTESEHVANPTDVSFDLPSSASVLNMGRIDNTAKEPPAHQHHATPSEHPQRKQMPVKQDKKPGHRPGTNSRPPVPRGKATHQNDFSYQNGKSLPLPDLLVKTIIQDVREVYRYNRNDRGKALFYKVARGGNCEVVKNVLYHMKIRKHKSELKWMFGTDGSLIKDEHRLLQATKYCAASTIRMIHFVLLVALFIISSPVWYIVHAIYVAVCDYGRKRLVRKPKLPLAYAVLGESREMIQLFANEGVTLDQRDEGNNNVFHYICDLSVNEPERALRCYKFCVGVYRNLETVKQLMMYEKNNEGYSPLELAFRYGSMKFLRQVMEEEGFIRETSLFVSKHAAWYKGASVDNMGTMPDELTASQRDYDWDYKGTTADNGFMIHQYDVTPYEQGNLFGQQSFLLHLLLTRDMDDLPEDEVNAFIKCAPIRKWIKLKHVVYAKLDILFGIVSMMFTAYFMFYLVLVDGDGDHHPLFTRFVQVYKEEVQSRGFGHHVATFGGNRSSIEAYCGRRDVTMADGQITLNDCGADALISMAKICAIDNSTSHEFLEAVGLLPFSDHEKVTTHAITVLVCGFVIMLWDIVYRLAFLCVQYPAIKPPSAHVRPTMPIPGSYLKRQLLITACYVYTVYFMVNLNLEVVEEASAEGGDFDIEINEIKAYQFFLKICMISILSMRLITCLYELRPVPFIGYFVIVISKLLGTLLKFLLVYLLIGAAFALVFKSLLRRPDCPILREPGFTDYFLSLFSTYNIMIGMGSFPAEHDADVMVAYVIYTIITYVLLLNFIIAAFSSAARHLSKDSVKEALITCERLREILTTEAMTMLGSFPLKHRLHCVISRASGFIVTRRKMVVSSNLCGTSTEYSVLFECEYD